MSSKKFDTTDVSKANPRKVLKRKNAIKLFRRTFVYALSIIAVSLALSIFAIDVANDALAFTKEEAPVVVQIKKGASVAQIASALKEAGIIKYKWAFQLFVGITNNGKKLKPGTRSLDTRMDYLEIVTKLKSNSASRETVRVTIPEGKEQREIVNILVENGVCIKEELEEVLKNQQFDYWFLKDLPKRDNRLEGYLFPDTYEFYVDDDPVNVVKKFLNNFDNKFSQEMKDRAAALKLSADQVVTLASIVEREAANDADRGKVASVFWNRLNSRDLPYLQSCATVQYVLAERRAVLSIEDTKIDSPYNTYLHAGLPVGPIASPGLASLNAALWPEKTNYYYFVVNANGQHTFSTTLEQHNRAVAQANKGAKSTAQGTGTVG